MLGQVEGGTKVKDTIKFAAVVTSIVIGFAIFSIGMVTLLGGMREPCTKWHQMKINSNEDKAAQNKFFQEHSWHVPVVLRDGTNIVITMEIVVCKTCGIVTSSTHHVHTYKLEK